MSANLADRIVGWFSPRAGLQRVGARHALQAYYEGAQPSKQRKQRRDNLSPNQLVGRSAAALRGQARFLERNHDIVRGILRTLVNNTVGPGGIGIEPQPRNENGEIHEAYAKALREAFRDWVRRPEVTHMHHWSRAQRLVAKAWFRDGEGFAQMLMGVVPFLDHGTRVPFSLELFEADMIPLDYDNEAKRIRQGIERNAWGRPTGYWAYKGHPLESVTLVGSNALKRIAAENVLHVASIDRIGQMRGVSEFASILTRMEDIKDYEESERIAAKIAAALTAYVKRGAPEMYDPNTVQKDENGNPVPRDLRISPGMIVDGLGAGEEIGLIDSKRPNPNVVTFRQGQLRAAAAGIGASYSSISRDYGGTYSSQRQELVEQWVSYAVLTDEFVGMLVQPVWESFVAIAHLSGVVPRPADVIPHTADDALFIGQSMPWINPLHEADAMLKLARGGFASEVELIRKRGGNPRDLLEQVATWRKETASRGLVFESNFASAQSQGGGAPSPDPMDEPSKNSGSGDGSAGE